MLERNARANGVEDVCTAAPCPWGDDACIEALGQFDVVLCSDVLYGHKEETQVALAQTMRRLSHANSTILIAYHFRENLLGRGARIHPIIVTLCNHTDYPRLT